MSGERWVVETPFHLKSLMDHLPQRFAAGPFTIQFIGKVKTNPQLAKVHAAIRDIARAKGLPERTVKTDVKREFGVVIKHTSMLTGEPAAYLKSFGDYTKDEMTATLSALEAWMAGEGL